jgi:hypothetical protein
VRAAMMGAHQPHKGPITKLSPVGCTAVQNVQRPTHEQGKDQRAQERAG